MVNLMLLGLQLMTTVMSWKYVSDDAYNRIQVFDEFGTFKRKFSSVS